MNAGKAKYLIFLPVLIILVYFLNRIFSGAIILPQVFFIGPLKIHYYGLTMATAVTAGFYLAIKRSGKFGLKVSQAEDLLFWIIIGGFFGARLYHIFSSFDYYILHPVDALKVWNGGLSIFGALLGGFIVLWAYNKLLTTHYSLLAILDWLTPSLILGQVIGRFGNLFNYEAFGYPTNLPWKMFVPYVFRPQGFLVDSFFHPFFMYEVLGGMLIIFLLFWAEDRTYFKRAGRLFFFYLLLYNSLRFGLEFIRIDSVFIGFFRLNSLTSLILCIFALIGFFNFRSNGSKT